MRTWRKLSSHLSLVTKIDTFSTIVTRKITSINLGSIWHDENLWNESIVQTCNLQFCCTGLVSYFNSHCTLLFLFKVLDDQNFGQAICDDLILLGILLRKHLLAIMKPLYRRAFVGEFAFKPCWASNMFSYIIQRLQRSCKTNENDSFVKKQWQNLKTG